MANSFKYLSERDRVVVSNNLPTQNLQNKPPSGWGAVELDYLTKFHTGSATSEPNVFDITYGRSAVTTGSSDDLVAEKNIYKEFSKILLGLDSNNNFKKFNLKQSDNEPDYDLHNAYFINFSRNFFGDKIQNGSVSLKFTVSGSKQIFLQDKDANNASNIQTCPIGNYGILYATGSGTDVGLTLNQSQQQGLIFYEAGIAVVSPYIFSKNSLEANPSSSNDFLESNKLGILTGDTATNYSGSFTLKQVLTGSKINNNAYALADKLNNITYTGITELNSTVYFCRAYNHEFNYSTNPTYVNDGEIVVKGGDPETLPRTYITTVGLYSDDNQLLAVAKLSEPILKTPENELIARVRLDF